MSLPVIAIVGRPNVGKSSLFNRILRKRLAVVDAQSGVTRDRHYSPCDWNGRGFMLVDTGGMLPGASDLIDRAVFEQSDIAIQEADLILLLVDIQTGPDTLDHQLAKRLLKSRKKSLLVANKIDNENLDPERFSFMSLGMGEPVASSATTGLGVAELLDRIVEELPEEQAEAEQDDSIRVALVGRPNVGKSSFINKLLGENRLVVSDRAGTTRDAVDSSFEFDDQKYILVDTAGLRRSFKVHENIEFYTHLRSERAISDCDVAVVIADASQGLTSQDQRILDQVIEYRRGAILAVNKWDLVEKDSHTADKLTREIDDILARNSFIPKIFISALSGQRVTKVLPMVSKVYAELQRRIPTPELNDFLKEAYGRKKPPARSRKFIQFKYVTQSEVAPPTFVFFASHPTLIDKSYVQYLANCLRDKFGFSGVPIRLKFRK